MKLSSLLQIFLIICLVACAASYRSIQTEGKLKIIQIDSTMDYFIFKTKNIRDKEVIVLGEKDSIGRCQPFENFIFSDSLHEVTELKMGSRYELTGFFVSTINNIKIRNDGELVKVIWNCDCFTK